MKVYLVIDDTVSSIEDKIKLITKCPLCAENFCKELEKEREWRIISERVEECDCRKYE